MRKPFSLKKIIKGMGFPLPKRISLIKFISAFIYEPEHIFRARSMREVATALLTCGG